MSNVIKNPIIPGFYPDPSICRVGDDFYICCSSFEAYPGLPIFHSKDLANWEQISYAMTKENGFHVDTNTWAGGIMAPTIRYNNGTYYIMNCNFGDKGNFMVTAKDPKGPWSDPIWLDDIPGIDASFFFDNDGKCYVMGTGNVVERADGTMDRGIWLASYDIENFKLTSKPVAIWDSALRVATSPEAPHLYHIGDYYYLMIAEAGTEHYHAVTIARSKDIFGWYEGNPANPVMTHRHFGFRGPIANVGHADFVDTPDGNWYAVMLGSRTVGEGYNKNFGRETFICPVIWEREWPIFSPGTGKMEFEYPADDKLPWTPVKGEAERDDFDSADLDLYWTFWGTPYEDFYRIADGKAYLKCLKHPIAEEIRPFGYEPIKNNTISLMGRRQRQASFDVETEMTFTPKEKEEAGMVIMQANNHQYAFIKALLDGKPVLRLVLNTAVTEGFPWLPGFKCTIDSKVLEEVPYEADTVVFKLAVRDQDYTFSYGKDASSLVELQTKGDGKILNPEEVGPMAGTLIAIYATGNGVTTENEAAFEYFEMKS